MDKPSCDPCLKNAELTDASSYYYPKKGKGKSYLCDHHAEKIERFFVVIEIEIPSTHGGKRPGSGRKPIDSPVDNTPIYCGDMEKELREAVMDLDPKARKFALASLVKMEMARCTNDQGLFIVALRDVIRDWEGMQ